MLSLTRRYGFAAGHRLGREEWTEERNRTVYGICANRPGHGHNYFLWVTVEGTPDPGSGMIIGLTDLDRLVHRQVISRLDHRFLNSEVPGFTDTVPTSENLCRFIRTTLSEGLRQLNPGVRLHRLRLAETRNNYFEI